MKKILLFLFSALIFSANSYSANISNVSNGNWSTGAIWQGGLPPAAGDSVTIIGGSTVTVDVNTNIVKSVNVVGTLLFTPNNFSDLKLSDGLTISGTVNNQGSIEHTNT